MGSDKDALGRILHDFTCSDPDQMLNPIFAERMRQIKRSDKEANKMQDIMREFYDDGVEFGREEGREEGRNERNKEVAADLLREGNMSASVIARISKLSEDNVRQLAISLGVSVL